MAHFLKSLVLILFLSIPLLGGGEVYAAATQKIKVEGQYDQLIKENKVVTAVDRGNSNFQNTIKFIFLEGISPGSIGNVMYVNIVVAVVAFLYVVFLGIKMIFNGGDEDKIGKYRQEILWIIVGLGIISAAFFIATQILNPTISDAMKEQDNTILQSFFLMVRSVETFLRIIIGSIALIMITLSGYNFLVLGDNDETLGKERAFAVNFLLGVGLILLSEVIILLASRSSVDGPGGSLIVGSAFSGNPQEVALGGIVQIVGIIRYILTFFAVTCLFMMIVASLYYVISFGDDDKTSRAKKIVINTVIGIVVSLSVLVIINVFLFG